MLRSFQFSPDLLFHFFKVFFRLFPVVWLFPGFGMAAIPVQVRVVFTIMLAYVMGSILPLHGNTLETNHFFLAQSLIQEIAVGLLIGTCFSFIFQMIDVAGSIISQQMGLSQTMLFTPILETTVSLPSILLSSASLALCFILDIPHQIITAFCLSYQYVPFVSGMPFDSSSLQWVLQFVNMGFKVGLQLAVPFIIANVLLHMGLGILNRLVPSVHAFFLAQPLQISLGLMVFLYTFKACLENFSIFLNSIIDFFVME